MRIEYQTTVSGEGQQPFGGGYNQPEQRPPEASRPATAESDHAERSRPLSLNNYLEERDTFLQAHIYLELLRLGVPDDDADLFIESAFNHAIAAWEADEPASTRAARSIIQVPYPVSTIHELFDDAEAVTAPPPSQESGALMPDHDTRVDTSRLLG